MSRPTSEESVAAIRALIAKRKRTDRLFNLAGAALIALSLAVLGALMVKLIVDGTHRLAETHDVRAGGETPGYRDTVGVVSKSPDGSWALQMDAFDLRPETDAVRLDALVGKYVAVQGDWPSPGDLLMPVSKAVEIPVPPPGGERAGSPRVTGVLQASPPGGRTPFRLIPEPLQIVPVEEAVAAALAELDGHRVVVTGRRTPATASVQARSVEELFRRSFFTSGTSRNASEAGIFPGLIGTLLVTVVTMLVAVPLGVAAGVYLEEYAPKNRVTDVIEINIANLAGVPSIIWGLLGLGLFIYMVGMGRTAIAAGMTLALLVLPIVIIATREAIRAVPNTIREAAIGLGATKWQTVRYHVIPYSMSGILTGSIIALSRAIGETAPLVCIGAVTFMTGLPGLTTPFTVVPIQIYDWVSRPREDFHANAAAASLILVAVTLVLNGAAILIRYRLRKKVKW